MSDTRDVDVEEPGIEPADDSATEGPEPEV
jgi:hypothetical protein